MGRIWLLAGLVAAIWLLSIHGQSRPDALGLDAPATQFSAARADAVLGRILGDQRPHPAGSAAAQAVRTRILKELAAMGVKGRVQTGLSCSGERRWSAISCATVTNIIADISEGTGKQILLMAHSDSVAAGPGAGDDGSGVATLLETSRALKARGVKNKHPITALFTDGEENGMLGAVFYLRDSGVRQRIGAVINVEARGNQGPSYLFQTSAGDAKLIDLYAQSVPRFAASSLYAEIYKYLPNDTDLTPFLAAGITAYNFAFIGNAAQYHTPLDRRENIDPRSLQQHGDNALGLAEALSRADLKGLKSGNAIYLDVLGRVLPRLPAAWALPLALGAFVAIALAGLRRRREDGRPALLALAIPLLLLAGSVATGFALHGTAAWLCGQPDPSFAYPLYLRLALAFGVFAMALMASRWAGAVGCWLWIAGLAVVCAFWAPGLSPYFLFPSLIAVPLLWLARGTRQWPVFAAALPALIIWIGLNANGEAIMGLKLHPLFTVSAAFGLLPLLPLLRQAPVWKPSFILSLGAAFLLSAIAGLQPAYTADAPERLNLSYVEKDGRAFWAADPVIRLPDALRAAANFSATPQALVEEGYVAPAGPARYPAPAAVAQRSGDSVTLDVKSQADGIVLLVPAQARLQSLTLKGVTVPAFGQAPGRRTAILCSTPDCATARFYLRLASPQAIEITLLARRRGLPPQGVKLLRARPAQAVPSRMGDTTILSAKISVPAR
ncbi:MAG TPA: M20/M25/M40 family metallo-hydrolase [Rhizomicrobium sp.]|nr:M20/M25/M40 family metallo-hydrolase [Rhizomicrobium sp.]